MAELEVDTEVLGAARQLWEDERVVLQDATSELGSVPTGGFGGDLAGQVATVVASWRGTLSEGTAVVEDIAVNLGHAARGYVLTDDASREAFESWLREAL
ncbi:hypothetical protein C8046_08560 [Serinibacter arcticus]|uniref:Uncharacterized protein n=1 Tax=Serinibacter arcticus TaxID=1655435 RepID=A0A2U1ZUM6_9MICO|nr:hypothetical protein [Serinibacter arcticus]PWD50697.1 hypothetical protein C8046_08560 [Serinibacter arcticus]